MVDQPTIPIRIPLGTLAGETFNAMKNPDGSVTIKIRQVFVTQMVIPCRDRSPTQQGDGGLQIPPSPITINGNSECHQNPRE